MSLKKRFFHSLLVFLLFSMLITFYFLYGGVHSALNRANFEVEDVWLIASSDSKIRPSFKVIFATENSSNWENCHNNSWTPCHSIEDYLELLQSEKTSLRPILVYLQQNKIRIWKVQSSATSYPNLDDVNLTALRWESGETYYAAYSFSHPNFSVPFSDLDCLNNISYEIKQKGNHHVIIFSSSSKQSLDYLDVSFILY